ncbi:MAG: hypothetical protein JXO51_03100 [Candidatus Aminicenantes bacterium]|nr:hypothetical protein [Candidatus Aminicenantes bacterium]
MNGNPSEMPDSARYDTLHLISLALLAGFFLPVVLSFFGHSKVIFVNIALLGKGSLYQTLMLLHPLLAGLAARWLDRRLQGVQHAAALLALGVLPMFLIMGDDLLSSSLRGLNFRTWPVILLVLSLVGLYVGSAHYARTGHASGRRISAVAAGAFIVISFVPITGARPPFYSFFELLRIGRVSTGLVFVGLTLIGVFVCYLFAAINAFINLQDPPRGEITAARAARLVLLSSGAVPLVLFLFSLGAGGFFMILFTYLKFTLWTAGVLGLIGWAALHLLEELEPATMTGAQLFQEMARKAPVERRAPPNIWDGPPPES